MAEAPGVARKHQLLAARDARRPFGLEVPHALRIVLDLVDEIVAVAFLADKVEMEFRILIKRRGRRFPVVEGSKIPSRFRRQGTGSQRSPQQDQG